MDPELWGPHVWAAIHLIALGSPEKFDSASASGYKVFIQNLPYVIPCNTCREHFLEYLTKSPPAFTGRAEFFEWTVKFHNAVNVRLGKPVVELETARKKWLEPHGSNQKNNWKMAFFILLAVFILMILIWRFY